MHPCIPGCIYLLFAAICDFSALCIGVCWYSLLFIATRRYTSLLAAIRRYSLLCLSHLGCLEWPPKWICWRRRCQRKYLDLFPNASLCNCSLPRGGRVALQVGWSKVSPGRSWPCHSRRIPVGPRQIQLGPSGPGPFPGIWESAVHDPQDFIGGVPVGISLRIPHHPFLCATHASNIDSLGSGCTPSFCGQTKARILCMLCTSA